MMNDAVRNLLNRLSRPSVEGRRRRFVATVLFSASAASSIPIIAALQSDALSDIRGAPGTFWLSGEAKGQVVLAATGGELASLALPISDEPARFDVVDTGAQVLVHDRARGDVTRVDGIEGKVGRKWTNPKITPSSDEPVLVPAGNSAYLIDRDHSQVREFVADPEANTSSEQEPVQVGPFDQWVGTSDGVLWLLDTPTGELTTVDGTQATRIDFANPGLDLTLSAIGNDPVVLDRSGGRLRWPRAAQSNGIPGFSGEALLQRPSGGGSCIVVVIPGEVACLDSTGDGHSMPITVEIPDFRSAQVFANEENVVLAYPNRPDVVIGSWPGTSWTVASRTEPSGRMLSSHFTPGALLIDDPGSRFAITADRGELTALDKFNQRTVVLSADGVATGAGSAAGGTGSGGDQSNGVGPEIAGTGQGVDDANGPDPRDDEAVTRVKRKKQIDVLANDFPRNSALAVKSVRLDSGDGTADVVEGASVLFTPTGNLPGQAELTYVVMDANGRAGSAQVHIEIVGPDSNTPPALQDDETTVASGVDVAIDVLANDSDAEGDELSITKVVKPTHGTASVNEGGLISYQSEVGFTGTDSFIYEVKDGYKDGVAQATVTITVTENGLVNRPPNPAPDRATLTAGTSVQVDALANDSDPDGDGLRLIDVSVADSSGLTVAVLPSQQVSIVAAATAPAGLVQVTYSVADTANPPHRVSSSIAVVVTANEDTNRPPIAVDDSAVVSQTTAKIINLTGNDSDPDGDPLTITSLGLKDLSSLGTVRQISQSSVEFTPAPGAPAGTTKFTYVVSDNHKASDLGTVTVQVVPSSNSGPVARDDIMTVFGGAPVDIQVLANDSHPDGLPLAISGSPSFSVGNVEVNSDGSITFTPPSADPRTYTFSYTIKDPNGRTATAQVVVTVDKVSTKSAPVAVNDQATTVAGSAKLIDVMANDADPDGQAIELVSVTSPAAGTGSVAIVNRSVRYSPPASFTGLVTFTYTIQDVDGNQATGTVVVQVLGVAKVPPTVRDDLTSMLTNSVITVDVLANDSDPDGTTASLSLASVTPPLGIGASVVGNKLRVTSGVTSGTFVIPYGVVDADGLTGTGKLTVLVTPPANQPPTAVPDVVSTGYKEAITIAVLANDTDPEGGQLTLGTITPPVDDRGAPAGSTRPSGNSVRYDPGSFSGGVATFSYVVIDDGGRNAIGSVRVNVAQCAANAPTPVPDSFALGRGQQTTFNLLANDGATEGEIFIGDPTGGRTRSIGNGFVEYTAPAAAGVYTFTYSVTNLCGAKATAGVTATVNRAPVAVADSAIAEVSGSPVQLNVLANDTDADFDALTITALSAPSSGTASVLGNNRISFRPGATAGPVTFTYTIVDCTSLGCGPASATGTVTVNVIQPNRLPVAVDDTATMTAGETSALIDVTKNDTDADNNPIILTNGFVMVSPPGGASISLENNKARFTPTNPCTVGQYVFTYWITDGQGDLSGDTGQVTVTINPQTNLPPVANPDGGFTTAADTAISITTASLLANDTDPNSCDAGRLKVDSVTSGTGGTAVLSGTSVTFTPGAGVFGTATFTYLLSDGVLTSSTSVSITVSEPPTTTVPPTTVPPTTAPPPATATSPPTTTTPPPP